MGLKMKSFLFLVFALFMVQVLSVEVKAKAKTHAVLSAKVGAKAKIAVAEQLQKNEELNDLIYSDAVEMNTPVAIDDKEMNKEIKNPIVASGEENNMIEEPVSVLSEAEDIGQEIDNEEEVEEEEEEEEEEPAMAEELLAEEEPVMVEVEELMAEEGFQDAVE